MDVSCFSEIESLKKAPTCFQLKLYYGLKFLSLEIQ